MKKVLSLIFNRWVLGVLGFLAIAFVIWFFGPLVSIGGNDVLAPESRRWWTMGVTGALMLARAVWKHVRGEKADAEIVEGIVEAEDEATPDRGAEEVELLKGRFEEAVQLLKKAGGKKTSLYDMPWYIIVGPPGSGKTTALVNSGLEFPLAEQYGKEALQGVGGTRNCDWWFTNDAVMLDTAGRYTTQDSDSEVDNAAWQGFLDLLKRHRKRRPINGVFVAISVQDLLTLTPTERASHAKAIKARINELYEHFGIRFPVYTMLTKTDLISGFSEFFDDLGQADREQVWGFTLPLLDKDTDFNLEAGFNTEFDALVDRVNERMMNRLQQEHDVQRRAKIFSFPQQVSALKPALDDFLMKVFKPSRYDEPVMWRGLYFTSGTQEGTPIDRLLGSLARTFGVERQQVAATQADGRSYFISDLLKRVAFPEAELAGTNRRLEIQRAWLQRASYIGVAAATVLALVAWFFSYKNNSDFIELANTKATELQEQVAKLGNTQNHPIDTLGVLDLAAQLPGGELANDTGHSWSSGLGLSQTSRLGRSADEAYSRLLSNAFLPRVLLDQETQMRRGWDNPEISFNVLKSYLMLDDDTRYDPIFVRQMWDVMWQLDLGDGSSADDIDRLNTHARVLTENMPGELPAPLDAALVERVRQDARRLSLEERVYARIRRSVGSEPLDSFTLISAGGSDAPLVFERKSGADLRDGIPGFFTYNGFKAFEESNAIESADINKDSWVFGDEDAEQADADEIAASVLGLYLEDYGEQYVAFLQDISLAVPSNMEETVLTLRTLSDEKRSPLRKLILAVVREIDLERKDEQNIVEKARGVADTVREKEQEISSRLQELTGTRTRRLPRVSMTPRQRAMASMGGKKLGGLKEMTAGENGESVFDEVLELLSDLYIILDDIEKSSDQVGMMAERSRDIERVTAKISRKSKGSSEMIEEVVEEMVASVQRVAAGGIRKNLNQLWKSEVLSSCTDTIANRYPFSPRTTQEIQLDDFGQFFGKGGELDRFYNAHLKQYIDSATTPWRWKGEMRGASRSALTQFERADRIRRMYFRLSKTQPKVRFGIKPVDMDRSITSMVFTMGEDRVEYDHGPQSEKLFSWPGEDSSAVRIELSPQSPAPSAFTDDSDWSLFKLLQKSQLTAVGENRDRYEVTLVVGGRGATFELTPKSAYNPFSLEEVTRFRCPQQL